jgi:hypothetical protein
MLLGLVTFGSTFSESFCRFGFSPSF